MSVGMCLSEAAKMTFSIPLSKSVLDSEFSKGR